ncbi:MAG: 4-alpha-glucanotransferase [Burkholderiales bacterium]|nr:4-alpha-glucanotransferase [Burkholderiales bacterium]
MSPSAHPLLSHRQSGVLLHITSLPGAHGSGDLGANAYHFVDWLVAAGQRLWQILPLSPVGPGNSPYTSPSTFAGNPLLVDFDDLVRNGWLRSEAPTEWDVQHCDFDRVTPYRMARLRAAWLGFQQKNDATDGAEFSTFRAEQAHWLDGYALFMALDVCYGQPWTDWPAALAQRDPQALAAASEDLADEVGFFSFVQWRFGVQWQALRDYAHDNGVAIVGDAPIFVAHHSADVWMNAAQYQLDEHGAPTVVAGVPPDYFSTTGQRWGNPLYRWDAMQADGFAWWKARLQHLLGLVDIVRVDHFRGFDTYWEIPASEPTAVAGQWCAGPGKALFDALLGAESEAGTESAATNGLPIIAEDLGEITPAVVALRQACGFPGMRVLQFAFGDTPANPYLPHNYAAQTVAYTGTHDNNTSVGWWQSASAAEQDAVRRYLGPQVDTEIHWAMLQALSQSVANTVIIPFQDVLGLDGAHRMNTPGQATDCWQWRFDWRAIGDEPARRLAALTRAHGRNLNPPL